MYAHRRYENFDESTVASVLQFDYDVIVRYPRVSSSPRSSLLMPLRSRRRIHHHALTHSCCAPTRNSCTPPLSTLTIYTFRERCDSVLRVCVCLYTNASSSYDVILVVLKQPTGKCQIN